MFMLAIPPHAPEFRRTCSGFLLDFHYFIVRITYDSVVAANRVATTTRR